MHKPGNANNNSGAARGQLRALDGASKHQLNKGGNYSIETYIIFPKSHSENSFVKIYTEEARG